MSEIATGGRRLLDEPVEIARRRLRHGQPPLGREGPRARRRNALITNDHERLRGAAGLVVPGVGHSRAGWQRLRELGLDELLRERVAHGTPVLGICLGMQLAFERSSEQGGAQGLGMFPARCASSTHGALKLPAHRLERGRASREGSPLLGRAARALRLLPRALASRRCPATSGTCLEPPCTAAPFASVVGHGSFYGVQFHPEKSSAAGLRLLANFGRICARAPVRV